MEMNISSQAGELPAPTPRLRRLRAALEREFESVGRVLRCKNERRAYAQIAYETYSGNADKPEIVRRAEFLERFAAAFPVRLRADELIVGSQRFTGHDWQNHLSDERIAAMGCHRNHGHIAVDYGRVVSLGVRGVRGELETMPDGGNRAAFLKALDAFVHFIRRHAKICKTEGQEELAAVCAAVAEQPATSFHQALQLVWFIQVFLHAEGNAAAFSFGRLDHYLGPILENDMANGSLTEEKAVELLACFCMKCCEGDESQNLVVGGPENRLSILILRAMRLINVWQPSLSVRIEPETSERFWDEATRLAALGSGMPSFFNGPVVAAALAKLDIPATRAADWAIVGCYEAAPQGDSFPMTVGGGFALPLILHEFLNSPGAADAEDFPALLAAFEDFFAKRYRTEILPSFIERWQNQSRDCPSPFESVCVTGCADSGLAAEEGGAAFNLFGVNILGLGTLVDSLLSVKQLINESRELTLATMNEQLAANFPDQHLLLRCRSLPGKFGSDHPESNELARRLSTFIAHVVVANPMPNGVRPYPGFFWFSQDIRQKLPATPDGRMANERVSYGCGPGIHLDDPCPTSILNAAAHVDHASCACGNPLTISLNRKDVDGDQGLERLRRLINGYFKKGGFHLHVNITNAETLREAQLRPEKARALTVRVSGFSARFIAMEKTWQDAIIERTEKGM